MGVEGSGAEKGKERVMSMTISMLHFWIAAFVVALFFLAVAAVYRK